MEDRRAIETHEYMSTIVGRCSRCQRTEEAHLVFLKERLADQCPVDHSAISPKMVLDDKGMRWAACPICQRGIEQKYIPVNMPAISTHRGEPLYPAGRGPLTMRQQAQLGFVAWRNRDE